MDQRAYRALGVTSARRTRWLPQLPSIAPSEFAALIESDFDKWGQVARKAGLDLQ